MSNVECGMTSLVCFNMYTNFKQKIWPVFFESGMTITQI